MKTPAIDYRKVRLNNLNTPEFAHLKLLLGWVGYITLYFLTENLIPADRCRTVHCWLDDVVPFCEWFIIPYVGWYALVFLSLGYFFFYDTEDFSDLSKYIIVTQVVAMACYIIFPTRQDLRPEEFANENVLTAICAFLYSFDTNTGVCPSLHVVGSVAVWLTSCRVSRFQTSGWKFAFGVAAILICLSTMFLKQHSVLDVLAAIPICFVAYTFSFRRSPHVRR